MSADTDFDTDATNLREELEFINEIRSEAFLREVALKQKNRRPTQQKGHPTRI